METPKCVPVRTCALTPCTGSPGYVKGWKWLSVGGGYFMMTYLGTFGLTLWQLLEADWGGGHMAPPPPYSTYTLNTTSLSSNFLFQLTIRPWIFVPDARKTFFWHADFHFFLKEGPPPSKLQTSSIQLQASCHRMGGYAPLSKIPGFHPWILDPLPHQQNWHFCSKNGNFQQASWQECIHRFLTAHERTDDCQRYFISILIWHYTRSFFL